MVCSRGLVRPRAQGCPIIVQTAAEGRGKDVRIRLLLIRPLMIRCVNRALVILAPFVPIVGLIGVVPEAVLRAHALGVVRG